MPSGAGTVPMAVLCLSFVFALPSVRAAGDASLRVMPEEAIPFTSFLEKAEFDRRFPGERVASAEELEPGWYVTYEHESLSYYFGPILLESTGRDYRLELESIVDEAVARRPSITGYTIDLRYEPTVVREDGSGKAPDSASGPPMPPQPKSSFNLFDMIRRIFGF